MKPLYKCMYIIYRVWSTYLWLCIDGQTNVYVWELIKPYCGPLDPGGPTNDKKQNHVFLNRFSLLVYSE